MKRKQSIHIFAILIAAILFSLVVASPIAATDSPLLSPASTSLSEKVLKNCKYSLDLGAWSTAVQDGGAGHLQGICCDDDGKYMYASFTNMLVKVDMETGEIVGSVVGMAAGSITSGAHIGDICYYQGKIYGALEYKAAERWYICVFDCEKINALNMSYTTEGVMYALYVPQVGDNFKNELNAGEHNNNPDSMGHRYGSGGIDGITFGTIPGKGYDADHDGQVDAGTSTGDKKYLIVNHGPYGNARRYDNENIVLLVFDPDDITENNLQPFNETMLNADYAENQKLYYKHKMFCYVGNHTYGVQQVEYDEGTGDLYLETYGRPAGSEFPQYSRFVVDGSIPLYLDTLEVGQSVTADAEGFITQAAAKATANCYKDIDDVDGDGNYAEQELGWHMTLKCLCGNGKTLSADHTETTYGATGHPCKICGQAAQFTTGLTSLGNGYFYCATNWNSNGKECGSASLYKINRTNWTFEKVVQPPRLLMSYTMDAADTYKQGDQVYLKDVSGHGYDALVEGTYSAQDKNGNSGGALGFRGNQTADVLDRVHMTDEAMKYINQQVDNSFSYSFWVCNDVEMDRFTDIIGMYRDEEIQKNLFAGVFEWRYQNCPDIIVHKDTANPVWDTWVTGEKYIAKPGTANGADGSSYIHGNFRTTNWMQQWWHYVVVRSGRTVTVYCNGEATDTKNIDIGDSTYDNLSAFEIGGCISRNWVDSNVRWRFTGRIDDVQIYAGELTQTDAKNLYTSGPARIENEGTGVIAQTSERTFATDSSAVLGEQTDPILHYTMDEVGNVKDSSVNQRDAIATKAVRGARNHENQENRALYFNGLSYVDPSKVTLSDADTAWLSTQINGTQKLTISFWMNAAFENSHRMSILGLYDKSGRPVATFETRGVLGQDRRMDGKFAIAFTAAKPYSGSGVIDEKTYEQIAITDTSTYTIPTDGNFKHYGDKQIGRWYHIVGELDQQAKKLRLFVDGSLIQEVEISDNTLSEIGYFMIGVPAGRYYQYENYNNSAEHQTNIGRQGWAMRDGFVGTLDDIQIYNRILTADEVQALHDAGTEAHVFSDSWQSDESGHWHVCTVEGCTATTAKETHTADREAPTETEDVVCSTCGYVMQAKLGHQHKNHLTYVAAKDATCTEDGHDVYYKCSCEKWFSDKNAEHEIEDHDSIKRAALNHSFSSAWSHDDSMHWHECSRCKAKQDEAAHTWDDGVVTTPATETEDGLKTFTCVCGTTRTEIIPKLSHTHSLTHIPAKAATVDAEGNIEYWVCSGCGKKFKDASGAEEVTDVSIPKLTPPVTPVIPSEPAKLPYNPNAGSGADKLPFTDVSSNSWYYSSVRSAWEKGLIDGVTASEFRPDATLTVAQAIKLAAALHQLDKTGTVTLRNGSETWYDSYVSYAVANGIIEKNYASYTAAQMNAAITRAEFVHIFHGAESTYKAINQVADDAIPDVKNGDAFASDIYEFYRAGILTGSDVKGTFHPASSIKRSEVATILLRMFETSARKSISLS